MNIESPLRAAPPRALPAIEHPDEVARLLAGWAAAFDDAKMPARDKPRLRAGVVSGKQGHLLWGARVGGIEINISVEVVSETRWRLDQNNQGALAEMDGRPVLLRQWYVRRAPRDASLSADEIAEVTTEAAYYVRPSIRRDQPIGRRLYGLVADLSAPAEEIRRQTAASVALHRGAAERFGFV